MIQTLVLNTNSLGDGGSEQLAKAIAGKGQAQGSCSQKAEAERGVEEL